MTVTFPDKATERKALGFLPGRFSGRVLKIGDHLIPEPALEALVEQNIPFTVKGKASYAEQVAAIRGASTLQFNDGRDVPAEWLADAVLEVVD